MASQAVASNEFATMLARPHTSLWRDAWNRLARNKAALLGLCVISFLLFVAIFADVLAPYHYAKQNHARTWEPPSPDHLLGTDELGRDVLSRLIYGARISMTVGVVAQFIILMVGVPLGSLAGWLGGKVDQIIMRAVDILYAFPDLLLIIIVMTYLRASLPHFQTGPLHFLITLDTMMGGLLGVFLALGLTNWLTVSRLVRGQILSLKQKEFIEAARCIGASDIRIMTRHLFPNILAPIIIAATFGIPGAIMTEAGLSFIGLGVQAPMPSWGMMVSEGVRALRSYPHLVTAPALAIAVTLLSFNFLGDGLRDALDPRLKL